MEVQFGDVMLLYWLLNTRFNAVHLQDLPLLSGQDTLEAFDLIRDPHDQLYVGMHQAAVVAILAAGLDLMLDLIVFWNAFTDNLIPRGILLLNKMLNLII